MSLGHPASKPTIESCPDVDYLMGAYEAAVGWGQKASRDFDFPFEDD